MAATERDWSYVPLIGGVCLFTTALAFPVAPDGTPGLVYFFLGLLYSWWITPNALVAPFRLLLAGSNSLAVAQCLGWLAMLAWWANPCFAFAVASLAKRRWRAGTRFGWLAVALSLMFLLSIWGDSGTRGHWPGPGYWLWASGMLVIAAAATVGRLREPLPRAAGRVPNLTLDDDLAFSGMTDDRIRRMDPPEAAYRSADTRLRPPR